MYHEQKRKNMDFKQAVLKETACFRKMCIKVAETILPCAPMSGDTASALNQKGNVVNAITGYCCHLATL